MKIKTVVADASTYLITNLFPSRIWMFGKKVLKQNIITSLTPTKHTKEHEAMKRSRQPTVNREPWNREPD